MSVQFDTLALSKKLEATGLERDQAEAIAQGVRDMITEEVATKADLATAKADLLAEITTVKADIADLKGEMRSSQAQLRQELKAEIADLRGEMQSSQAQLRQDVQGYIAELRAEMADLREDMAKLEVRLTRTVLAGLGATVALIKILDLFA